MALALIRGSERVDRVRVFGRKRFRESVRVSLLSLRDLDLPAWGTITTHVDWIIEGWRPFIAVNMHPAFIFLDSTVVNQNTHLAGTLAHMACSCQLYRDYEVREPGRRVPREQYSGPLAKQRCDEAYRQCVEAIQAASPNVNRELTDPRIS